MISFLEHCLFSFRAHSSIPRSQPKNVYPGPCNSRSQCFPSNNSAVLNQGSVVVLEEIFQVGEEGVVVVNEKTIKLLLLHYNGSNIILLRDVAFGAGEVHGFHLLSIHGKQKVKNPRSNFCFVLKPIPFTTYRENNFLRAGILLQGFPNALIFFLMVAQVQKKLRNTVVNTYLKRL